MSEVRVFLSSPGDVSAERAAVERVAKRLNGQFDDLEISVYRYERDSHFSAHTGFQEQIPDVTEFDIVVGILWSRIGCLLPPGFPRRLGTSAPYPSGTAFEILSAIEHRRATASGVPEVFVYRKLAGPAPAPPDDIGAQEHRLAQLKALNEFIATRFVNETDGFSAAFTAFNSASDFEALFERHMRRWLTDNRAGKSEQRWRIEERGSPYRGLQAFDADHRDVFFGRRADVERARERLETAAERDPGVTILVAAIVTLTIFSVIAWPHDWSGGAVAMAPALVDADEAEAGPGTGDAPGAAPATDTAASRQRDRG